MGARSIVAVIGCLVSLYSPGRANQRQVEHRAEVAPNARVEIANLTGTVRVIGWERNEVAVQATLGEGIEGLSFESGREEVQIEVEAPRRRRAQPRGNVGESHLEISVPRGATLDIETLAASITVQEVDGEIHMETSAGDITYAGGARVIEADSAAGDIEIDSSAAGARIDAEGLAGSLMVQFVDGTVSVTTVTGDVRVIGGRLNGGDFESTSGLLYFEGEIAEGAEIDMENFNGDIDLLVPDDTAAEFDISTYSGSIETEFGYSAQQEETYSPEQRAEFTLGQGGATVDIETFAGSVSVRRR